jgi:hypothetical protein
MSGKKKPQMADGFWVPMFDVHILATNRTNFHFDVYWCLMFEKVMMPMPPIELSLN